MFSERDGPSSFLRSARPSRWEYVGYAEINKGFKRIMNFRVLAASAQAPQRSNGNDFPPHNAPRPEGVGGRGRVGGSGGGGWLFKGRWRGGVDQHGVFCALKKSTHFPHAFHLISVCFIRPQMSNHIPHGGVSQHSRMSAVGNLSGVFFILSIYLLFIIVNICIIHK